MNTHQASAEALNQQADAMDNESKHIRNGSSYLIALSGALAPLAEAVSNLIQHKVDTAEAQAVGLTMQAAQFRKMARQSGSNIVVPTLNPKKKAN